MKFLSRLFRFGRWADSAPRRRRSPVIHDLERLEAREMLTAFLVTSIDDTTATGTLRWAIEQANANVGADSIVFDASFDVPRTIFLVGTQLPTFTDTSSLTTITGPGQNLLTISGNDLSRVFEINANVAVKITDLSISHGQVEEANGGGISTAGRLELKGVLLTHNFATTGGGIYVASGGQLDVSSSAFENNQSSNDGGAIGNYGLLSVTNTRFTDNSSVYGGAISNNTYDGPAKILVAAFEGNQSTQIGGAIYNYGSGLTLSQSSLFGNSSDSGGAIANLGGGNLQLNSVFVYQNTATVEGGAILNSSVSDLVPSVATIINCSIHDNAAAWGGGIENHATLLVKGSQIEKNSATHHGAGIANSGTLTVSSTTLSQNTVDLAGNGGGISNFGTLTVTDSTFDKNDAGIGGGIYSNRTLSVVNSHFHENSSTYSAGAIWIVGVATIDTTTFTSNTSSGGAGIFNAGTLQMWNSQFQFNTASTAGGAIGNNGVAAIYNSTFLDNQATYAGGAIANSQEYAHMFVYDGIFARNTAREGGAFSNEIMATLLIDTARISGNSAEWNGGGIRNAYLATLRLSNAMLVDNTASQGGGLHNTAVGEVVNSTFARNSADQGGGIYNGNEGHFIATLSLLNATVADNHVAFGGGGLYLAAGNQIAQLVNTLIARNDRGNVPDDIQGSVNFIQSTNNLIGSGGSGGLQSQVNDNIVLGENDFLGLDSLDDNGGFTLTMALLPFSPAIDAGTDIPVPPLELPPYDQRGFRFDPQSFPRKLGLNVDIGAYESHHGRYDVNVFENLTLVPITLLDESYPQPVTFEFSGGDDQSRFAIDPDTGVLSFLAPPDYEHPSDANHDNLYEVRVTVTDTNGTTSLQQITVRVENVLEGSTIVLNSNPATVAVGSKQPIDPAADYQADAAVSDYSTARLVVSISQGRRSKDQLQVLSQGNGTGQIKVKGNKVLFGGVVIATVEGGSKSNPDLTIRFYATTSAAAVRALLKRISFSSKDKERPQPSRILQMQILNLAGGQTNMAMRQILFAPNP